MKKYVFFLCMLIANNVFANIVLPSIFSDNMVLQQEDSVKLWGWANPSEEVTINTSWDNRNYTVKADNQARWSVMMTTPSYGGPYTIRLSGFNTITLMKLTTL